MPGKIYKLSLLIFVLFLLEANMCQLNKNNEEKKISAKYQKITAREAINLISQNKNNSNFIILDVRTKNEFDQGHLKNAQNINFYSENFTKDLDALNKTKTYLIYCRTGHRSGETLKKMTELHFDKVYDMGAIMDWINKGYPVVK
jgi:rhodanese-related sulfurtransferase